MMKYNNLIERRKKKEEVLIHHSFFILFIINKLNFNKTQTYFFFSHINIFIYTFWSFGIMVPPL